MTMLRFPKPIDLGWPAAATWYKFLAEVHQMLGQEFTYDDKCIILASDLEFHCPPGHDYQQLKSFTAQMIRFNERSTDHGLAPSMTFGDVEVSVLARDGPKYYVKLYWMGQQVTAIEAFRVHD